MSDMTAVQNLSMQDAELLPDRKALSGVDIDATNVVLAHAEDGDACALGKQTIVGIND
jgi:hypothetical protein